jgi:hypothetical protein
VVQRFLLDGINAKPRRAAVGSEDNLVVQVCPHETHSPLALPEATEPGAQIALDSAIIQDLPEATRGSVKLRGFSVAH